MTDNQTPPDWVLECAAKRSGWTDENTTSLRNTYAVRSTFAALCDMIAKHEPSPVDRKLLCAREVVRQYAEEQMFDVEKTAIRAIELWENGYGRD